MKFHVAWDSLEKENRFLKILIFALLFVSIGLSMVIAGISSKDALVIERGCYSRVAQRQYPTPTDEETKAFIEEAVKARFNSGWMNLFLLSHEQMSYRDKEQEELKKQKMRQTVVVNSVELQKDEVLIDADRVISVGNVRSTFKFPLKIRLEKSMRSDGNPYGLVLCEVNEVKAEVMR